MPVWSEVCSVSGSEVYCGWENGGRVGQKNWNCNENSWGNGRKSVGKLGDELESKDASVQCDGGANDNIWL